MMTHHVVHGSFKIKNNISNNTQHNPGDPSCFQGDKCPSRPPKCNPGNQYNDYFD